MKKLLTRNKRPYWYWKNDEKIFDIPDGIHGDLTDVSGNLSCIRGDLTDVRGNLSRIHGDLIDVSGNLSGISGDLTGISGDLTGIIGDLTGIRGDLTDCELTKEDRIKGVDISELIKETKEENWFSNSLSVQRSTRIYEQKGEIMKNIALIIIIESLSRKNPISYALEPQFVKDPAFRIELPDDIHGFVYVTDFKIFTKNSEDGLINWIQVIKHDTVIMEIKESACAIFGCDEIKP